MNTIEDLLPPGMRKEIRNTLDIYVPPLPPPLEILTAAERALLAPLPEQPATVPLFRFVYRRQYSQLYKTQSIVLREDHAKHLKQLSGEHFRERPRGTEPLTPSAIVNSALDFALEHPRAFQPHVRPENLPDALAREVYRSALTHFWRHEAF